MYQQRESVVLSDGLAPFGDLLPYPLVARPNGQRNIIFLERPGIQKTFNISYEEIEELYAYKQVLQDKEREKHS